MAAITGITGTITFTGKYITNVRSWTLDIGADIHDSTDFTTSGWKTKLAGLKEWSGSYEAFLDDTTLVVVPGGAAAALVLTASTGRTFTGTAIVGAARPSASPDALNTVTHDFEGTGALTPA